MRSQGFLNQRTETRSAGQLTQLEVDVLHRLDAHLLGGVAANVQVFGIRERLLVDRTAVAGLAGRRDRGSDDRSERRSGSSSWGRLHGDLRRLR